MGEIKDSFLSGFRAGGAVGGAIGDFLAALSDGSMRMRPISPARERKETIKLHKKVAALYKASPLSEVDPTDIAVKLAAEACRRAQREPASAILEALYEAICKLMTDSGLWGVPAIDWSHEFDLEESINLRRFLQAQKRFFSEFDRHFEIWTEKVARIFGGILGYFPDGIIAEDDPGTSSGQSFKITLVEVADDPADIIERLLVTIFDDDIVEARLFEDIRGQVDKNLLAVSGIDPKEQHRTTKTVLLPTKAKDKTGTELAKLYLRGTPFLNFLTYPCAFGIPLSSRFEHCVIVGGSGHGKTQLLQLLIHDDLLQAREDKLGLCVIDSQGDLLKTISHLAYFSPKAEKSLADKLVLIDPNDTAYPVCLNMFDMKMERLGELDEVERERILNATVALYEYMFGALLGAELTQRQGVIFKYLARLMMVIPGATVHTLRALMEDARPFRPYVAQLEGTTRAFFETQFFSKSFEPTKKQILTRLWGVLSNTTFDRMFSHERNKVDLFDAMQSGKVVLIHTAKDLLQKDGCQILGRFFIAMLGQATLQRAAVPEQERLPFFVYIDEAHEYFDERIEDLVNQARKYKVGLTLAMQNLDQLGTKLSATVLSSTSIKLAGGVSSKDAAVFAREMQCTPEFIRQTRKTKSHTSFACYVRNISQQPVKLSVPLGVMERKAVIKEADYQALIALNRERVAAPRTAIQEKWLPTEQTVGDAAGVAENLRLAVHVEKESFPAAPSSPEGTVRQEVVVSEIPRAEVPASPPIEKPQRRAPVEPAPLGRGGKEHKYLQGIIKQMGQERGYRAIIEKPVLDGSGSVDVSLERNGAKIACEISITTAPEQELGNIQKCLAAGYEQVILLSSEKKHLNKMKQFVASALEQNQLDKVLYYLPDDFIAYLDEMEMPEYTEQTVRGYKVKVQYQTLSEADKAARRKAIAETILQSVRRLRTRHHVD